MDVASRRRSAIQRRACAECQKRKTRCLQVASRDGLHICSYCRKAGKHCTFEALPSRTPLTRKNLDAAERRTRQLESLFRSIRPDLNLDAALHDVAGTSLDSDADENDPPERQSSPPSSDEFEWHETAAGTSNAGAGVGDGMANLPAKSQEAGYLGNTSGSKLLQTISSLMSPDTDWPDQDAVKDAQQLRQPEPLPPLKLQLSEQLATTPIVETLVNTYFHLYHSSYPILHESAFRDKYQTRQSGSSKTSFQITFYMVLAIGHWLLAPEKDHSQTPYYAAARSMFTIRLLEAGTLGTVQALLLMGNYLQKRDMPNTGYNLVGIAYRMALGLGLHREAPMQKHGDIFAHERRRQVFWTLYCFDSGFSITTGRPTTIPDSFIDSRLPRNIDDTGATMTSIVPPVVDFPTPHSAIIAQSQLAIIANRIHAISMSAQAPEPHIGSSLASTEKSIDEWRCSLPPYFSLGSIPSWFRAPRAVLFWKEQNLRILLWQALERRPSLGPGKVESQLKCCTASLQAVFSISSFCSENTDLVHRGLSWYATYFLFQATLVLLLFELQTAQAEPGVEHCTGSWTQGIAQARDCLTLLGKDSNAAKRCLAVLHRIQSGALLSTPGSNNTASPTTVDRMTDTAYRFGDGEAGSSVKLSHMLLQDEASPENAALFGSDWSTTADPSLSTFLEDNSMQGFFQDFNGFPGTVEHNHFDYINYNMYNTGYQG